MLYVRVRLASALRLGLFVSSNRFPLGMSGKPDGAGESESMLNPNDFVWIMTLFGCSASDDRLFHPKRAKR